MEGLNDLLKDEQNAGKIIWAFSIGESRMTPETLQSSIVRLPGVIYIDTKSERDLYDAVMEYIMNKPDRPVLVYSAILSCRTINRYPDGVTFAGGSAYAFVSSDIRVLRETLEDRIAHHDELKSHCRIILNSLD